MCGIYGYVGAHCGDAGPVLAEMERSLVHRGPDEGGISTLRFGAIGMRRLAIIDVEGGHQPLGDSSGRYHIVFNGEIYNYKELREELRYAGEPFSTRSDTEVILAGYRRWGVDVVHRLRGMFAFAIIDDEAGTAFFARDHLGKKPLYFWEHGEQLFFSSEAKALMTHPAFSVRIDLQALSHYLTLKHVPAPYSMSLGVQALPAGHRALFERGSLRMERYYAPRFDGESALTEEEAAEELLRRLRRAVQARMITSDVPVGAYLSGGLDSSLVAALAVETVGSQIHTFSMGYEQALSYKDDVPFARLMAHTLGTEHHELLISPDRVIKALPAIVKAFDEPFGGTISPYLLTALIRNYVKVAVSGDGADELFGSYAAHRAAAVIRGLREGGSDYGSFAENREVIHACLDEPEELWRTRFLAFTDSEKRALFPESVEFESTGEYLGRVYGEARGDLVNRTLEVEVKTLLPDGVLTYVDRLSMAHSVEVRAPFLDVDLVEFAGTLPGDLKVTATATKSVLKRAAAKVLPQEVVDRPKVGFVLPIDTWLGTRFNDVLEHCFSDDALSHGLFDAAVIRDYVREQRAGSKRHTYKIWSLVMFQLWFEAFVSASSTLNT